MESSEWFVHFLDHQAVMKQVYFWAALLIGVPAGILMCRMSKWMMAFFFFMMVFTICEPDAIGMNFFPRLTYRAPVRGIEIYGSDLCSMILFGGILLRRGQFKIKFWQPLMIPFLFYLAVGIASWLATEDLIPVPESRRLNHMTVIPPQMAFFETGIYPFFEIVRAVRAIFAFWVSVVLLQHRLYQQTFLAAIAVSAGWLTYEGLYDRYVAGTYRVMASLLHPNDYAHYCAMLGALLLPFVYYMRSWRVSGVIGLLVLGMIGAEILSVSRSGLAAIGLSAVITTGYFAWYRPKLKTWVFTALGALGVFVFVIISRDTLMDRFMRTVTVEESIDERMMFNLQAIEMGKDYPLGVGLGNFSAMSWVEYADRVDPEQIMEPGVPAHNIWFLTLGEMGVLGLLALIIIWVRAIQLMWRTWFADDRDWNRALLLGLALGLMTVHIGSLVHFSYRNIAVYQLMHVFLGGIVAFYLIAKNKQQKSKGLRGIAYNN